MFKNHDLKVFHVTSGTKKCLLVPISLKNIQERKTTVKEREEGKGDRVAFFKKRDTCAVNN